MHSLPTLQHVIPASTTVYITITMSRISLPHSCTSTQADLSAHRKGCVAFSLLNTLTGVGDCRGTTTVELCLHGTCGQLWDSTRTRASLITMCAVHCFNGRQSILAAGAPSPLRLRALPRLICTSS